jgi:Flp pilus assembly protein TadG
MRAHRERRGATMVLIMLMMVVIMGFAAMAIDVSSLYGYRSELQRSADAAAHAAAMELTRPTFNTADGAATTYANANPVAGQNPTVDSLQYGTWDQTTQTFTTICNAPCGAGATAGATAFRVWLSATPQTIFAQFMGVFTLGLHVSATSWAAPTVPRHDCSKPFAVRYQSVIAILNAAEGRALPLTRDLDATDLTMMRANAPSLLMCLRESPTDQCNPSPPPADTGTYKTAHLYPASTEGPDPFLFEIEEPCASSEALGPDDTVAVAPVVLPGDATTGADQWCANFNVTAGGPNPCLMKLALWDTTGTIGTTATDSTTCVVALLCLHVRAIVPFIVTSVTEGGGNVFPAVGGYPIIGIDEAAVATTTPAGAFDRVILAH